MISDTRTATTFWRSLCCLLTVVFAMLATWAATDQPFIHPLFTDNMVLQRNIKAPVYGWSEPGTKIVVTMHGKTATAIAGKDGYWLAKIGPFAAGGPYNLTISGPQTITIKNVLVGDVWLCSGQSNMEMGVGLVNKAQEEIANANYPQIRLFDVPKVPSSTPQRTVNANWQLCTPQTISAGGWGGFSASAYFFGRHLYQTLHVPIGIIDSSWGGTVAEAWTSADSLRSLPDFASALGQIQRTLKESENRTPEELLQYWYTTNDEGTIQNWAKPDFDDSNWEMRAVPGGWDATALLSFDGTGWYRTTFVLPKDWEGKDLELGLGPIDDMDTTWVNGVFVGSEPGFNIPRKYTIPATVLKPGKNIIAVRALDTGGEGGINGQPEQVYVRIANAADSTPISLATNWRFHTGTSLADARFSPIRFQDNANTPTVLYNGMIAPLVPFGIKGAIWYQGEANVGRAVQYRTLLATLIKDWRVHFGQKIPFFIVQLAGFQDDPAQPAECGWAELRDAQYLVMKDVPNTGLAVAIDIGDKWDIHPKNKQEVGRRLGLSAQAIAYGQQIAYSGPEYRSMKVEGNSIRLSFTHIDGGLVAKDNGKLVGFAIAGADMKFVWADATIQGNTVVVSSPQVEKPIAVRYAWANTPQCNLYNKAGLPAIPFRTDRMTK